MTPAPHRYSGLAAVATLWSALAAAALLSGFPLLGKRPLSWLAAEPSSSALFGVGLAVAALFLVAFHGHVRLRYQVSRWFSVSMLTGLAGQLVAAVVPINGGGVAQRVHTAAALTLGASLPVLMWRFAVDQPPGRWRRVAHGLFWAEGAACLVGVVLSRMAVAPLAEILPAACFHVWIVVLTLSGPGQPVPAPSTAAARASVRWPRRSPSGGRPKRFAPGVELHVGVARRWPPSPRSVSPAPLPSPRWVRPSAG